MIHGSKVTVRKNTNSDGKFFISNFLLFLTLLSSSPCTDIKTINRKSTFLIQPILLSSLFIRSYHKKSKKLGDKKTHSNNQNDEKMRERKKEIVTKSI